MINTVDGAPSPQRTPSPHTEANQFTASPTAPPDTLLTQTPPPTTARLSLCASQKRCDTPFHRLARLLCQYSLCERVFRGWRLGDVIRFEQCVEVILNGADSDDLTLNGQVLASLGTCYWRRVGGFSVENVLDRVPKTKRWNDPNSLVVQGETIRPLSAVPAFCDKVFIRLRESGNVVLNRMSIIESTRRVTDFTDYYSPVFHDILTSMLREGIRSRAVVINCRHGGYDLSRYLADQTDTLRDMRFCYGSAVRSVQVDMANMAVADVLKDCHRLQRVALQHLGLTNLGCLNGKAITTAVITRVGRTHLQGVGLTFDATVNASDASTTLPASAERLLVDLGFGRWAFTDTQLVWRRMRHLALDCLDYRTDLAHFPGYTNVFEFLNRDRFPSLDLLLLLLPSTALSGKLRALASIFAPPAWHRLFYLTAARGPSHQDGGGVGISPAPTLLRMTILVDTGEPTWSADVAASFRELVPGSVRLQTETLRETTLECEGLEAKYVPRPPVVSGIKVMCTDVSGGGMECEVTLWFGTFNAGKWFAF